MKKFINLTLVLGVFFAGISVCIAQDETIEISEEEQEVFDQTEADSVAIADAESKYEILIIEPGFYTWLTSIARPEGYYSQHFLENRNQLFVMEWNRRVIQPTNLGPDSRDLYLWQIDYDPNVDYGYDVNYKLYNYFIYFQRKYKQKLSPYQPRI